MVMIRVSIKEVRWFLALALPVMMAACSGGGGGGDGGPVPTTNVPRFAFVAAYSGNAVLSYVVDAATGRLKYIGQVAAGAAPRSVTVDPSGRYAYVA
ncbi:MAG TPA: beta-propeller fold lactonase family protein, partial [Burkholderiales bacterium]|nr:beta-propeller fold lactonase family protein [Burkholderiales bacterium]